MSEIKKYLKKPVAIEAYQTEKGKIIHSSNGVMSAGAYDYIITGADGEQYPCEPYEFLQTHELIENR